MCITSRYFVTYIVAAGIVGCLSLATYLASTTWLSEVMRVGEAMLRVTPSTERDDRSIDPRAVQVLSDMEKVGENAASLTYTLQVTMWVRHGPGPDLGYPIYYESRVKAQRPNLFYYDVLESHGEHGGALEMYLLSDGQNAFYFVPMINKYHSMRAREDWLTTYDALQYPMKEDNAGPQEDKLSFNAYDHASILPLVDGIVEQLELGYSQIVYHGEVDLDGRSCHHIGLSHPENTNVDIWIDAEGPAFVRQVVVDWDAPSLRDENVEPGEHPTISYMLTFGDWALDIQFSDDDFRFEPPKGSVRVDSIFDALMEFERGQGWPVGQHPGPQRPGNDDHLRGGRQPQDR